MKWYGCLAFVAVLSISVAACISPRGRPDYTASGALAVYVLLGAALILTLPDVRPSSLNFLQPNQIADPLFESNLKRRQVT